MAAYAYEVQSDPIMSDAEFDELALRINPTVKTGNLKCDMFFRRKFEPHTGSWVHDHPDTAGLHRIYATVFATRTERIDGDEMADIEDLI